VEPSPLRIWTKRVAIALTVVVFLVGVGVVWRTTHIIDSELLSPAAGGDEIVLDVEAVSGSRITFADDDDAAIDGVWGVAGPNGYGQVTRVISRSAAGVERGLAVLTGTIAPGDAVVLDTNAFPADPRTAHGIPFEEVRVPSDAGVNPAWLVDGARQTWVIFVHGRDHPGGRTQALRALPAFRRLGLPTLVITYRSEAGAGGESPRYSWGLDEWRDLESAVTTAVLRGADDFVLVGCDMGASIVATFLHESDLAAKVRGVVFDSAVLDFEALVDRAIRDKSIPGYLAAIGKAVARIRFGLEWSRLDQVERASELDPTMPVLLLHGSADDFAPVATADAFAAALPQVRYERFEGAMHGALWNSEPVRYEEALTGFLVEVVPELAADE
jgi:pimeloyl-ACP methyl ester carboxylesterase